MAKKTAPAAKETKAVATVAQTQEVALTAPTKQAWGSEDLSATGIIMPKLLLMQGLSKFVTEGEAAQGQIVNSLTKEVVGGITNIKTKAGTAVDLVAFKAFKTWLEFEKENGEWVYKKGYPMTADNVNFKQEEIINGVEIRRDRCLNYYCLQPSKVASGEALPVVVSFRRTSMKAGKKLATMAAELKALGGKPLAFKHFSLSAVPLQKDDKTFWGFEVEYGERSTEAELNEAFKWYSALKSIEAKIDDSDLREPEKAAHAEPTEY